MNTAQLAKNIAYMVSSGDYIAGHSIFVGREDYETLPNKILKEGLIIEDVAQGLSFTTRQFEPIFEDCLENILDLSKNSSGFVVIISIPRELLLPYNPQFFNSCNNSSIVLEPTGRESIYYKDIFGKPTKTALLPSIYILGYLNVQENLFIQNPNYAFNNKNKNINIFNLKPILDERYEKILEKNGLDLTKKL